MNNQYNIWNSWDPLQTVMVGNTYSSSFFREVKNSRIRSALSRIADETQEDLDNYEKVLKDFGCTVLRPYLDPNDSIMNYINDNDTSHQVPRPPLQVRDCQLVIGNELYYTGKDHPAIKAALDQYNNTDVDFVKGPFTKEMFLRYKGDSAPDWPTYDDYVKNFNGKFFSNDFFTNEEFKKIHDVENNNGVRTFPIDAPQITLVGKDVYMDSIDDSDESIDYKNYYYRGIREKYPAHRFNQLTIGGHNDAVFQVLKEGVILSLHDMQHYEKTFPGWDVHYVTHPGMHRYHGFLQLHQKVSGKWWLPDEEDNDDFTNFVETWLKDWVGFVEESVFNVNVLVLDEHHVCVNTLDPDIVAFLKKHNMEPVHVPWRHRFFWDGGLHCITLDLCRKGTLKDYFPDRTQPIIDEGFGVYEPALSYRDI
jgi:hypothetical protein